MFLTGQRLASDFFRTLLYVAIFGFVFFGVVYGIDLMKQKPVQSLEGTPTTTTWNVPIAKSYSVTKAKTSPQRTTLLIGKITEKDIFFGLILTVAAMQFFTPQQLPQQQSQQPQALVAKCVPTFEGIPKNAIEFYKSCIWEENEEMKKARGINNAN